MRVKFWTISLLVVGVAVQVSLVSAVKCNNDDDCVEIEFSLKKCEGESCKCVNGYEATDWGCTKYLGQPIVSTLPRNSLEAFEKATVTVTCKVDTTGMHSFKWFKDNNAIPNEYEKDYKFKMGVADKKLQCQVFAGAIPVSDKSSSQTIKILKAQGIGK
ncbi:hypothetical protein PoB_001667800 [Plakobranchus ocellatus]|uniref:Ig-like domain-containing protein n=1 Tax=Plakobranchus ocellatus TaxID=259542 RepID=A0AAV3Z6S7_9GAST|nr:hypothetical protein PoB_001667800 [Plakobranchus ocellatus]